jgi:hypothetical protein
MAKDSLDKRPTVRQLARWLRREFPVVQGMGRLRLRVFKDDPSYGYATPGGTVQLNTSYSESLQRETLLHEWAHLRVGWVDGHGEHQHPTAFWVELGKITNAYFKWIEGR